MRAGQRAGQYSDYFLLGLLLTPPKVFPKLNPNLQLATCNLAVQRAGQRAGQYSAYFLLDYFLLQRAGQRAGQRGGWTEGMSSRGLDRGEGRAGQLPSQGWTGLDREGCPEAVQRLSRGCPEGVTLSSHFGCTQGVYKLCTGCLTCCAEMP